MKIKKIPAPDNWKDLKPHPLSALCPYGAGLDTVALANHMRQHGYAENEPIVLLDDMILDGRHRHVAAQEADVVPTFAMFVGGNPVPFIFNQLHRRHLSTSQRAMMGARILEYAKLVAKRDKNQGQTTESAILHSEDSSDTWVQAAMAASVSRRSIADAAKVQSAGGEELQEQVIAGQVSVSAAARVVKDVFCPRCQRCGPARNCAKCQELRAKTALAERRKTGKPTKPKKPGSEAFSWKDFKIHLGFVIRGLDAVKRAYPGNDEHIELDALMDQFCKVWGKLQKRATGVR